MTNSQNDDGASTEAAAAQPVTADATTGYEPERATFSIDKRIGIGMAAACGEAFAVAMEMPHFHENPIVFGGIAVASASTLVALMFIRISND